MILVFYLTYLSVLIFFLRRVRQFESVKLHNLNSLFLQLKAIRAALQSISSFEELDKLYEGLNIRGIEPYYRKELIQRVIRSGYQPFDPVFPMDDWFSQAEQMAKYRLTILSVFGWNLCFMSATWMHASEDALSQYDTALRRRARVRAMVARCDLASSRC